MNNTYNLKLYGFYAPRYERLFGWLYTRPQRRAVALLNAQPGERVFVPGVGTGMGLAELPADAHITAIDLSPAMLAQAQRKLARPVDRLRGDGCPTTALYGRQLRRSAPQPDPVRRARRRRSVPRGVACAAAGRPRRDLRQVPAGEQAGFPCCGAPSAPPSAPSAPTRTAA